jgi:hypothetical protein
MFIKKNSLYPHLWKINPMKLYPHLRKINPRNLLNGRGNYGERHIFIVVDFYSH